MLLHIILLSIFVLLIFALMWKSPNRIRKLVGNIRRNFKLVIVFVIPYLYLLNTLNTEHEARVAAESALRKIETENHTRIIMQAMRFNTTSLVLPNVTTIIWEPSPVNSCENDGRDIFILFVLLSSPTHFERRKVIRKIYKERLPEWETLWANIKSNESVPDSGETERVPQGKLQLLFFIGNSSNTAVNEMVIAEHKSHGDTVIDNFQDCYANITLKLLRMLKYVETKCSKIRHLVKFDDDIHLNVPLLFERLKSNSSLMQASGDPSGKYLIAGFRRVGERLFRNPRSKWFTPRELWRDQILPDHITGPLYVFGSESRAQLYKFGIITPLFHMEDVFITGIVRAKHTHLNVTEIEGICHYKPKRFYYFTCKTFRELLLILELTVERMECFGKFLSKDFVCDDTLISKHCSLL